LAFCAAAFTGETGAMSAAIPASRKSLRFKIGPYAPEFDCRRLTEALLAYRT
jgi:hypothetical protein